MSSSEASGARMRAANEKNIIGALRRNGAMTKTDLAGLLGLTRQAVNTIVGDMVAGGLLREGGRRTGGVGRSSTFYSLEPTAAGSIGLDIGPGRIDAVLVDFLGDVHFQASAVIGRGDDLRGAAESAARQVRAHCAAAGIGERIAGVGALLPSGAAASAASEMIGETFGLPVYFAQRAELALVAEKSKAGGQLPDNSVYISVAKGVTAAVMLDGNVRPGTSAGHVSLGQLRVSDRRLAEIASLDVLGDRLAAAGFAGPDIYAARLKRPDLLETWMNEAADALGRTLAAVHLVLGIEAVVIDTGLPGSVGLVLLDRIRRALAEAASPSEPPFLLPARLGAEAALLGAAMLPLQARYAHDATLISGRPSEAARTAN